MKGAPTQKQMMNPSYPQQVKPNYVDKNAVSPSESKFYPNRCIESPSYIATNPRYWEYR